MYVSVVTKLAADFESRAEDAPNLPGIFSSRLTVDREKGRVRCDSVAAGSGVLCNQIADKPFADATSTLPHLCADLTDDELTTTVSGKCGEREREREREREDLNDDELTTTVSGKWVGGERERI